MNWLATLTFFTGLFTAAAVLSTWKARAVLAQCEGIAARLRKQATTHELIVEEFEAIKKRQHKLAGRFYHSQRGKAEYADVDDGRDRDPDTVDALRGNTDAEFEALLELQRQSAPHQN